MVFSSLEFLFFFLPLVSILYFLIRDLKIRNFILIVSSVLFYAFGEPKAILIMLMSIVLNYGLALLIEKVSKFKKVFLFLAVVINIGLLFIYKYADFFIGSVNYVFKSNFSLLGLPLPIGISFFTFQAMSYVIDVYRKDVKAQKKILNILLYISFFPQLIAGPIVKYHDIEKQIDNRKTSFDGYCKGVHRFLIGLFKKVLIANNVGLVWENILNSDISSMSLTTAWIGAICYSLQIYFDFSAYSDMAIGLGKMFGFDFLENFNYPYISKSIREFWRRWHISLSTWFKEYLYIPLGGNRISEKRTYVNLFIVFLATGLWHGASWNFIIWGLWHGFFSIIERLGLEKILKKDKTTILSRVYTLFVVVVGFTIFAITDFNKLREYIGVMILNKNHLILDKEAIFIFINNYFYILVGIVCSMPIYLKIKSFNKTYLKIIGFIMMIVCFIISIAYLVSSSYNPFLYFRF